MNNINRNFLLIQIAFMISFPLLALEGNVGRVIQLSLGMCLLMAGLMLIAGRRKHPRSALAIAFVVFVLWLVEMAHPRFHWLSLVRESIFIFFYARIVFLMARQVFLAPKVRTSERLYGAISIYLMISGFFGNLFTLILMIQPDAFACSSDVCGGDVQTYFRSGGHLYFSLITLTTVGYGDITPVYPFAGMLAAIEALLGQLYVAVVVARLVGLHLMENVSSSGRGRE